VSRLAAVLLVLVVSVLTACGSDDSGGSSTSDKAAAPSAQTSTQTTTPAAATSTETTQVAATPEKNATVVAQCHAVFDPYLTMLHGIRDTVDGAPEFKAYITAVDAMVKDFSSNINDVKMPSTSCQKSVLGPLTASYIRYYNASLTWRECRKRKRCAAAMPDLKKQWKQASTFLASADKGFSSVTAR
jgi:hypothetical protein